MLNGDDLQKVSKKVTEYHQNKVATFCGHNLGTVEAQEAKSVLEDKPAIH